jgi:hypothetical protein
MSTPIGAALSIFVRGNTMKGRTRAKEEAFIRGDGDRLQVLSKPCMAPSIQEKGRSAHPHAGPGKTRPSATRHPLWPQAIWGPITDPLNPHVSRNRNNTDASELVAPPVPSRAGPPDAPRRG